MFKLQSYNKKLKAFHFCFEKMQKIAFLWVVRSRKRMFAQ